MNNKELPKFKNTLFLLLLLGLVFLRFPFLFSFYFNLIPISKSTGMEIYWDGTYLITAVLVVLKRDSLSEYFRGSYSLALLLLAPFAKLYGIYLLTQTLPAHSWFQIVVSICLLIILLIYHPKLRIRSLENILLCLLVAIVVGICTGAFAGKILRLQFSEIFSTSSPALIYIRSFFCN